MVYSKLLDTNVVCIQSDDKDSFEVLFNNLSKHDGKTCMLTSSYIPGTIS